MKYFPLLFSILFFLRGGVEAWALTYTRQDSLRVVELLGDGARQPEGTNLMLYYGHRLLGVPYVGQTLEVNPKEELVVNLRQLDCTTFVETALALALTTQGGGRTWENYCQTLTLIRYRGGKMQGYVSRNHYFSQWIESNVKLGVVSERKATPAGNYFPFTATQRIDLHYMSRHPDLYPMLKGKQDDIARIRKYEEEINGKTIRYIPSRLLDRDRKTLQYVEDGDVLALVTSRDGLDISHVGIAEWGADGKLHLLNASSIYKKVVLDEVPLYDYMMKYDHRLGIRVLKIKSPGNPTP